MLTNLDKAMPVATPDSFKDLKNKVPVERKCDPEMTKIYRE